MGLSRHGFRVLAADTNEASLQWALEQGIIAGYAQAQDSDAMPTLLSQADYLVLALYPQDINSWLRQHKQYFKPGALITDLAGVKSCFVEEAQALLGEAHEFIPSHPMAGREVSGVRNANDAIFAGANFLITPTSRNTPAGISFAKELAKILGFARHTILSIQEHDAMIGYVSQLTHAIAVSLMNANADPRLPEVTGDSFRDLTRIANMNASLWSELFLANREALTLEIDQFSAALHELRKRLAAGDKAGLEELFCQSTQRRQDFDKKSN